MGRAIRPTSAITLIDGVVQALPGLLALLVGGAITAIFETRIAGLAGMAVMAVILSGMRLDALKRTLFTLVLLETPLQIDMYIGNDPVIAAMDTISGFNVSVSTVALVALYLFWAVDARRRVAPETVARGIRPALIYLGIAAVSTLVATRPLFAGYELFLLMQCLLLLIYVVHWIQTPRELVFVVAVLAIGISLQGFLVIALSLTGASIQIGPLSTRAAIGNRVSGTLGHPNSLGSYLALALPSTFALFVVGSTRSLRALGVASFGLGSIALALSFSRGAWVGIAVGFAAVLIVALRLRWLSGSTLFVMGIIGIVVAALLADPIISRIADYNNPAALARLPLNEIAFSMITDHPVLGVGINNFAASMDPYITVDYSQAWITTVHNKYLLVWAETGVIGLIAFLVFLIAPVVTGIRVARRNHPVISPIALAAAGGIIANAVQMLVALFHGRAQIQMLWVIVGVLVACGNLSRGLDRSKEGRSIPESELVDSGDILDPGSRVQEGWSR